ncbi:MAG: bifunctional phosphopantothenoylcysteine decarboxylase/phosphopantothenate--cysteine ligase CoaBC [Thermoplasmatales archaeon]|nr:MAG: bifunctional phosphopantothenoylcysteine decarboxylase/phosphopantothenate--cysteine ligase CoaBC [Thermoplasmatales archaeon]
MHPADEIRGIKSKKLSKKSIVLGVTGSIAAVESIKLSRELVRHGADVYPVMSKAATRIIHPNSLEFATSNKPIIELTGKAEHVSFCGLTKDRVDLLLISPCTANTISKIALGIDDTPVTTFATTAIGSGISTVIVPAMHLSMYAHKIVQENIDKCKRMGISFIDPLISGNKAKMPSLDEIVEYTIRIIGKQDLKKKNILIIGGATAEPFDDIRILTNRSSGKTAVALANNAFERGANVELWYGHAKEEVPLHIPVKNFETVKDLLNLLKNNALKFDSIIVCAAIADYLPKKQKGKISSGKNKLVLDLSPAPKIIQKIRLIMPKSKIIAFKVEESKENLQEKSYQLLKRNQLDFVIGNTISAFGKDENEILIINKKGESFHKKGNKEELANYILDTIKRD